MSRVEQKKRKEQYGEAVVKAEAGPRISQVEINTVLEQAKLRMRDELVLRELGLRGILGAEHLARLCYVGAPTEGEKGKRSRFGQLVELGLLAWSARERKQYYYWLTKLGIAVLRAQGIEVKAANLANTQHSLLAADFMVAVLEEARYFGADASWQSEIELGVWKAAVRPDAGGRFSLGGGKLEFAVEIDRRTMSETRIRKKVAGYEQERKAGRIATQVLLVTSAGEKALPYLCKAVREARLSANTPISWFITSFERLDRYVGVLGGEYYGPLTAPVWLKPEGGEPISMVPTQVRQQALANKATNKILIATRA